VSQRKPGRWGVSFRTTGQPADMAHYRNPVDAARAVLDGRHNEGAEEAQLACDGHPAESASRD